MGSVTLTFDNGPTVDTTPRVLEELRCRDLTAYFCLVGKQLLKGQEQIDIASEAKRRGHILVNHSLTHGTALGDDVSAEHARQEIVEAHTVLTQTIPEWNSTLFRPFGRGGDIGPHLLSQHSLDHFRDLNYSVLLWNSVPRDWEDIDGWVDTALTQITQQTHTVIVLHDLNTGAMEHLGRFLDAVLTQHETTMQLPEDCVPIKDGNIVWENSRINQITT